MARLARVEVFAHDEVAIVHVMNRTVRRCFLMGNDPLTGKNFDHRKAWLEIEMKRLAGLFGIDLLCFAILSNHFHLILRSRHDVVRSYSDKGFLPMPSAAYLDLLDWTSRQIHTGKKGVTPATAKPIFERLGIWADVWCELVRDFGRLFYTVAGQPHTIDSTRSRNGAQRYKTRANTRELLSY